MINPEVIVPMFTKLPVASILCVPDPLPVFIPTVPFNVVPVIVLLVSIDPNPVVIDPEFNAPTLVKDEFTILLGNVVVVNHDDNERYVVAAVDDNK